MGGRWAVHNTMDSLKKARHTFNESISVFPSVVVFNGGKPGLLAAKGAVSCYFQANKGQSNITAEPDVVYVGITDFDGYQTLNAGSTRFLPLPPMVVSQRPGTEGSGINRARTLYLYAAANNSAHRQNMAWQWSAGENGNFGLGIGQLLDAYPTLHGTFAGDAFVDFSPPEGKVEGAALAMLLVNRFTKVNDIIWDLTADTTTDHHLQLPTLPAAAMSLSRNIVCMTENLDTWESICKSVDFLMEDCQLYFDNFWEKPTPDGEGISVFYKPNVIPSMQCTPKPHT